MVNAVVTDLKRPKTRNGRNAGSVRQKRLRNSDGAVVNVLSLDANSATFIDDLTTVFAKNVARARRENRQLFGSPDGRRAKK